MFYVLLISVTKYVQNSGIYKTCFRKSTEMCTSKKESTKITHILPQISLPLENKLIIT